MSMLLRQSDIYKLLKTKVLQRSGKVDITAHEFATALLKYDIDYTPPSLDSLRNRHKPFTKRSPNIDAISVFLKLPLSALVQGECLASTRRSFAAPECARDKQFPLHPGLVRQFLFLTSSPSL